MGDPIPRSWGEKKFRQSVNQLKQLLRPPNPSTKRSKTSEPSAATPTSSTGSASQTD
jgi:hypothetical protein